MLTPLLCFITLKLSKFTFSSMSHNYQKSFASKGNLQIQAASVQAASGKNAFIYVIIQTWNDTQKENERCDVEHIFIS